ncbi:alpha/beta fold hydrolase [Acaryochloris sp. IP29b_bin.137]|uniref:alpha/beta fold hydrolase n=1 Tax=Acaryochloris sp. IP29b_bin.137 TaxID=2969217 RepID=UPI0026104B7D|nr:alpha/beta fold hydrolase [Acaryochloris sp. IP29b_bin.137]
MTESTFLLVHGSWMGKFCWSEVIPRLEEKGFTATSLDLPAHGDDPTTPESVTLDSYRDSVVAAVGERDNIILVGHSMSGMVISSVGETIPTQIKALVYLCAYLPQDGESIYQLASEDTDTKMMSYWRQNNPERDSPAWLAKEGIIEVFGEDCPPKYQELLVAHHRVEPMLPCTSPVKLTDENFGSVPRYYIETLNDNAVSHQHQVLMLGRVSVKRKFQLQSSHCPFFSMPKQLVECLIEVIENEDY